MLRVKCVLYNSDYSGVYLTFCIVGFHENFIYSQKSVTLVFDIIILYNRRRRIKRFSEYRNLRVDQITNLFTNFFNLEKLFVKVQRIFTTRSNLLIGKVCLLLMYYLMLNQTVVYFQYFFNDFILLQIVWAVVIYNLT